LENRRRYERVVFRAKAEVISLGDQSRFTAYVSVLSRGGLGMHSQRFLEVNTPVEIKIPALGGNGGQRIETVRGEIVGALVGEEGNSYGVEFDQVLNAYHQPLLFAYLEEQINKGT
jgi:PilZ domain